MPAELAVGSTPLRRLTRAQYANAVRDALGIVADVSTLDSDEKAGAFDSNYSASVSPDAVEQYRAAVDEFTSVMQARGLLVESGPILQRCRHPVMDTDEDLGVVAEDQGEEIAVEFSDVISESSSPELETVPLHGS